MCKGYVPNEIIVTAKAILLKGAIVAGDKFANPPIPPLLKGGEGGLLIFPAKGRLKGGGSHLDGWCKKGLTGAGEIVYLMTGSHYMTTGY
jgi:hypothetical protein